MPTRLNYYASRAAARTTPFRRASDALLKSIVVVAIALVALVIVGVISPSPGRGVSHERAMVKSRRTSLSTIESSLERFANDCGQYPDAGEGLAVLTSAPPSAAGWKGPYLRVPVANDVWERPLRYERTADGGARVSSAGPDETWGTADDLAVGLPPFARAASAPVDTLPGRPGVAPEGPGRPRRGPDLSGG